MRKRLLIGFLGVLIVFALLPAVYAQFEEQVRVNLLEIWVKVTDGKQVVTDLNPEDFRVYIDGKEVQLRCFDKTFETPLSVAEGKSDNQEAADMKRKYIFFFDLLNTSPRNIDFLKKQIVTFMQTNFHETDEGMVFALLPTVHLGVVQPMTSSKDQLVDVVQKMRGNATLESRVKNNEKEIIDILSFNSSLSREIETTRGSAGTSSRSPEQIRTARGLARSYAAQEENLSKFTLNSFLSIANYLSGNHFDGRLVMIYISGGFPLRPGQNYYEIVDRAVEDTQVVGSEDLGFRDRPTEDFEHEVRQTVGLLNRLNVTIYSIDAKGLITNDRGPERDSRQIALGFSTLPYQRELQDSLVLIASETGGTAFTNSQNFQLGLADLASDMNQQYWLCADMPASDKKGVYHKIEVRVDRPGIEVRHRQGYIE